jgi:hypothetical protein
VFDPCFYRNLEVHNSQKWIVTIDFSSDVFNDFIFTYFLIISLSLGTHFKYSDLVFKLDDLHFLVDLHSTVLSSHASVQKLIEKDKTFVNFDSHL